MPLLLVIELEGKRIIMLMDHVIIRILSRIWDIILLNLLWILTSLPIITIGASTTALYSMTLKMVVDEEGGIIKCYFKAWKENFKKSTILWMLLMVWGILLGTDYFIISRFLIFGRVFLILSGIVWLFYIMEVVFAFPLLATFENSIINTMKNAILIPVAHLPQAIFVLLMTGSCVLLSLLTERTIIVSSVIWILFGVASLVYVNSLILRKMFENYFV